MSTYLVKYKEDPTLYDWERDDEWESEEEYIGYILAMEDPNQIEEIRRRRDGVTVWKKEPE